MRLSLRYWHFRYMSWRIRVSFREHLSLPVIYGTCKCICTFLIYGCFVCHSRPITCTWSPQQSLSAVMSASCNYYPMHSICKRLMHLVAFFCVCVQKLVHLFMHILVNFFWRGLHTARSSTLYVVRENLLSCSESAIPLAFIHTIVPWGFQGSSETLQYKNLTWFRHCHAHCLAQ